MMAVRVVKGHPAPPSMNGQLSQHPLVELIHEISDARLSGALRLAHERVKGVVYFDAGQVVAALTNLRAYRLVEILRRAGAVAAGRLDAVVGEGASDEEAGAALVRAGALAAAELSKWRERQSAEVLRALLRWTEGEWGFDPRVRLAAEAHARLNTPQLLVEGARLLPPERAAQRMADAGDLLSPAPTPQGAEIDGGVQLLPTEAFVLSRVGGPTRPGELIAVSGLPEAETMRAAYALALGGLLVRERWPRALPAEASRATTARREAESPPRPAEQVAPGPETPTPAPETPPAPASDDPRALIEELFERARRATHYEVLGVARSAKADELKRVYYGLARRLHPDRFRRDTDETIRQQIDAAFAKITQAHEVLKDARLRAAYDMKLPPPGGDEAPRPAAADAGVKAERAGETGRGPAADPPAPAASKESEQLTRAEGIFQQGLAALQQNNVALARRSLGEAALLAPRQARYRAYYGRALARDKNARRQAESELQAAITLDEKNPSYRVMLAELYQEHGLRRRAEGELERALQLDPRHAAARRLLEQLRGPK